MCNWQTYLSLKGPDSRGLTIYVSLFFRFYSQRLLLKHEMTQKPLVLVVDLNYSQLFNIKRSYGQCHEINVS